MTTLSIIQPSYLPWLGYFDQIKRSDYFIFYDDVQYDKNGWRNRNKIKLNSKIQWLTVPVVTKNRFGQLIMDVQIHDQKDWRRQHLKMLHHAYSKSKNYDFLFTLLEEGYKFDTNNLSDLNIFFINIFLAALEIKTKVYKSSEILNDGNKNSRLVNFCLNLGVNEYLTGDSASEYLDIELFKQHSINITYQKYNHPEYKQLGDSKFSPYLSIVDLLANEGSNAIKII